MAWRTSPEYKTVSEVLEAWFNRRFHQSLKDRVYDQPREIRGEEFGLLLSISRAAVG